MLVIMYFFRSLALGNFRMVEDTPSTPTIFFLFFILIRFAYHARTNYFKVGRDFFCLCQASSPSYSVSVSDWDARIKFWFIENTSMIVNKYFWVGIENEKSLNWLCFCFTVDDFLSCCFFPCYFGLHVSISAYFSTIVCCIILFHQLLVDRDSFDTHLKV